MQCNQDCMLAVSYYFHYMHEVCFVQQFSDFINPYTSITSSLLDKGKLCKPRSDATDSASGQGPYCLLT